jgi:hypothetical protein
MIDALPKSILIDHNNFILLRDIKENSFMSNIKFIKEHKGIDDSIAIISRHHGLYHLETKTTSLIPGPGMAEIILKEDWESVLDALDRPLKKVFIDENIFQSLPVGVRMKYRDPVISKHGLYYISPY